jgi:hypothetical protein
MLKNINKTGQLVKQSLGFPFDYLNALFLGQEYGNNPGKKNAVKRSGAPVGYLLAHKVSLP